LDNTSDPRTLSLDGVSAIALHFPKFSDGRAFTQAHWLRRRLGFTGALIATGDVLIDQLQQMQRCGFSHAVLRADQDPVAAQRLLGLFSAFYQGDAIQPQPRFAQEAQA
jgi:uncharacterized protein (DUF934 family)